MRLPVLRIIQRETHLDVVALDEHDVPLSEVLEHGLQPFRPQDVADQRMSWRNRHRGRRPASERDEPVPRLRLRGLGGEANDQPGFLVYRSKSALIDLLLRRWEPDGDDAVSTLIRRLRSDRRLRRGARAAQVEAFLSEVEERPEAWAESALLVPGSDLQWSDHEWLRLPRKDAVCYAHMGSLPLLLAIDHPTRIAGHPTLRRELLICHGGEELLHLDGSTLRRYTHRCQLPASVYQRFDADGVSLNDDPGQVLPLFELWPRFLLVVPDEQTQRSVTDDDRVSQGPAWLVDPWRFGHYDRFHHGLTVLEGAAAAAVLARTTDNISLPAARPRQTAWLEHPPGTLLVGALPFPDAA
ncbi:MAG: hypothetical protein GXP62_02145 [Oligoflexia bacterium]|nr:hypothetical protein [Oligoflexia bacterium]